MEIVSHDLFRVTRDADFEVSDEANDLLRAVEDELRRRRFGEVVRLEVSASMDPELRTRLLDWLDLDDIQVYDVEGMLDLGDLWQIVGRLGRPRRAALAELDPADPPAPGQGRRRRTPSRTCSR